MKAINPATVTPRRRYVATLEAQKITQEMNDEIRATAEAFGLPVTDVVRMLLTRGLADTPPAPKTTKKVRTR